MRSEGESTRTFEQNSISQLLIHALDQRWTGALEVLGEPEHVVQFDRGLATRVLVPDGYARLGELLVQRKLVGEAEVVKALAAGKLLGRTLVHNKSLDEPTLQRALTYQVMVRLQRIFSLPQQTSWRFVADDPRFQGMPAGTRLDTPRALWAGIEAHGETPKRMAAVIGAIGETPLAVRAEAKLDRFGFQLEALLVATYIVGERPTVEALFAAGIAPAELCRRVVYTLAITRYLTRSGEAAAPIAKPISSRPGTPGEEVAPRHSDGASVSSSPKPSGATPSLGVPSSQQPSGAAQSAARASDAVVPSSQKPDVPSPRQPSSSQRQLPSGRPSDRSDDDEARRSARGGGPDPSSSQPPESPRSGVRHLSDSNLSGSTPSSGSGVPQPSGSSPGSSSPKTTNPAPASSDPGSSQRIGRVQVKRVAVARSAVRDGVVSGGDLSDTTPGSTAMDGPRREIMDKLASLAESTPFTLLGIEPTTLVGLTDAEANELLWPAFDERSRQWSPDACPSELADMLPAMVRIHDAIHEAYVALGDRRARNRELREAGIPVPDEEAAELHRRALQALSMNLHAEALRLCQEACTAMPQEVDYQVSTVWIRAHLPHADPRVLVSDLDEILSENSDHVPARYYRGLLRRRLGIDVAARMDFERVVSIDPKHSGARQQLEEMTVRRA